MARTWRLPQDQRKGDEICFAGSSCQTGCSWLASLSWISDIFAVQNRGVIAPYSQQSHDQQSPPDVATSQQIAEYVVPAQQRSHRGPAQGSGSRWPPPGDPSPAPRASRPLQGLRLAAWTRPSPQAPAAAAGSCRTASGGWTPPLRDMTSVWRGRQLRAPAHTARRTGSRPSSGGHATIRQAVRMRLCSSCCCRCPVASIGG